MKTRALLMQRENSKELQREIEDVKEGRERTYSMDEIKEKIKL